MSQYLCPSSVSQYSAGSLRRNDDLNNGPRSWSGPNAYGLTWFRFTAQATGDQAVSIHSVNSPSEMYMLTEVDVISGINNQGSVGHTHTSIGQYLTITESSHHEKLNLHGNLTINTAFVDGSLSLQRHAQLSQTKHWYRNQ